MPLIAVESSNYIYYRLEGVSSKPVLILSHSLGVDHGMWDPQMPALLAHFRVLRYDTRGHGASSAPEGEYSIERLARDAMALANALNIHEFAFCGLSLGGMTGQWIAAHAPQRVKALVLANTSAKFSDPAIMQTRRATVLANGMEPIIDGVMQRFFSQRTLARGDAYAQSTLSTLRTTNPAGYAGCCAAVRDLDNRELLGRITCPTLVIGGDDDQSTPWTGHADLLLERISNAKGFKLPGAHLSNLEHPRSFTSALLDFLVALPAGTLEAGIAMRRSILGDPHVDRALANTTDFNRPFQEYITRNVWGRIWTRPGLDVHTRRLLVLTATAAMGRWEEFRLHVRTGLEHELELCDLQEVLLQLAAYAGVPAANTGFQIAAEEIQSRNV